MTNHLTKAKNLAKLRSSGSVTDLTDYIKNDLIFMAYDPDSGKSFVEKSPANRKTESNSIGYIVRFFKSLTEANKVKAKIDRFPYLAYLAEKYFNIV